MTLTKWNLGDGKQWTPDGPWNWNTVASPETRYFQQFFQAIRLTDSLGLIVWFEPTGTVDDGSFSHNYTITGYALKGRTVTLDASLTMGPIVTLFTNLASAVGDEPEGLTIERLDDTYAVLSWGMRDFLTSATEGGLVLINVTGGTLAVADTYLAAPGFRTSWPGSTIVKIPGHTEFYWFHNTSSGSSNTATYEHVAYTGGTLTFGTPATLSLLADGPVDGYWDPESLVVSSDGRLWVFQTGSMVLGGTLMTSYTELLVDGSTRDPLSLVASRAVIAAPLGSWWTASNTAKAMAQVGLDPDERWAFGADTGSAPFAMGFGHLIYTAGVWACTDVTVFEMPAWSGVTANVLQGIGSSTTFGIYPVYYSGSSYPWCTSVAPNGLMAWSGPVHFPSGASPLSGARVNGCWVANAGVQGYVFQDYVFDGATLYQSTDSHGVGLGGVYAAATATFGVGAYSNTQVIAANGGVVFLEGIAEWDKADGSPGMVTMLSYAHWVSDLRMRAHYNRAVMDKEGNLIPGCTVRMIDPADDVTTLPDTIYTGQIGSSTRPNPFVCDTGIIDFYLEAPKRVTLGVTRPGSSIEILFDGSDVLAPIGPPPPGSNT